MERAGWGNLGVGIVLACVAVWFGFLHSWDAFGLIPGSARVATAGVAVTLWLAFSAWTWHRHRRVQPTSLAPELAEAGAVLIAYASQTGFADQLAKQTEQSLRQAGMAVRRSELGGLADADLRHAGRVLFVVSTTGEGDAPDSAARFADQIMRAPRDLHGVQYGLLALGDRDYDDFCGFGRALQHWLAQGGAMPLFDPVEVDNGDDGALRHWQHHLSVLSGAIDLPDWQRPAYQTWRLRERRLSNPDSLGGACFHLALESSEPTTWQAGDIAEIEPRHTPFKVQQWLQQAGLDGTTDLAGETLAARLARSLLPEAKPWALEALCASLQDLPHREYSIASLPADGAVHLLVRLMQREDGQPGLGSAWLTAGAAIGDDIAMRIRANPNFHAPATDVPMILIGNGTGLAGLRALLKEREVRRHHRNWLIFGEREQARDFFHREDIARWQHSGHLQRVDLAWSRDAERPRYVQACLIEAAAEVCTWVEQGAAIYVCGSLAGMAPGVDAALRQILGDQAVEQLRMDGRYRRDVY